MRDHQTYSSLNHGSIHHVKQTVFLLSLKTIYDVQLWIKSAIMSLHSMLNCHILNVKDICFVLPALSTKPISVLKRGDPLLAKVSQPVEDLNQARTITAALSTTLDEVQSLYNFERGSGISAPQIGQLFRISLIEYGGIRQVLINPEIIDHASVRTPIREGCLSFFDYRGAVPRYSFVKVRALNDQGDEVTITAHNDFAMLLQHEIDHLDGILYVERLANQDEDLRFIENMPAIP